MSVELPFPLTPFKVILSIFVIFTWTRVLKRYHERTFTIGEFLVWTLLWGGGVVAIYIPGKTDFIARLLGVGRGADAIFTLSILTLFYIIYRLYAQIYALRRDVTKLVQRLARERTERM